VGGRENYLEEASITLTIDSSDNAWWQCARWILWSHDKGWRWKSRISVELCTHLRTVLDLIRVTRLEHVKAKYPKTSGALICKSAQDMIRGLQFWLPTGLKIQLGAGSGF